MRSTIVKFGKYCEYFVQVQNTESQDHQFNYVNITIVIYFIQFLTRPLTSLPDQAHFL